MIARKIVVYLGGVLALLTLDVQCDCSRCPSGVHCDAFLGCAQCESGKQPPDCVEDCPDGWYGLNCSSQCGRCWSEQECDKISGLCALDEGCDLWYAGPRCDIEVVIPRRTNEEIRIKQTTNSSIEVMWEEIRSLPSIEEEYYKYRVEYKRARDSDYQTATTVLHKQHSTWNWATIGSLQYDRGYEIRVVPYREMDGQKMEGDVYGPVDASTKCGTPDPPTLSSVEVESDDMEKILVEFESVSGLDAKCDTLTEVWIEYRAKGKDEWKKNVVNMTSTVYTLSPSGGGTYEVRVTVINNGNITSSSKVKMVIVKDSIPYLPYYVTVITIILCLVIIVTLSVLLWKSRSTSANSNKREQTPFRILSTGGSRLYHSLEGPFQSSSMAAEASGSINGDHHNSSVALSNRRETEYENVSNQVHYEALSNENRGVYQNNATTGPYTEIKATRN